MRLYIYAERSLLFGDGMDEDKTYTLAYNRHGRFWVNNKSNFKNHEEL